MLTYRTLSQKLQQTIKQSGADPYLFSDPAIRRNPNADNATIWRPAFVRDVEKILHCPYYNRYSDKTQVFSLIRNDDISRRGLHVQLVSRIARNIGRLLGLNLDLIEAIALGHDIGHTPFGHAGEQYLNKQYHANTGLYFHHNVQSVRILDSIFRYNISLQTLDGILCHNGEFELQQYRPAPLTDFQHFDRVIKSCDESPDSSHHLIPATLEGCVVRVSDMIAYLGKDRQDALRTNLLSSDEMFEADNPLGKYNATIINNMVVSIIEHSYGKDCLMMDEETFKQLKKSKEDNYRYIYGNSELAQRNNEVIAPMFELVYQQLVDDFLQKGKQSLLYRHHIAYVLENSRHYGTDGYEKTEPNRLVADYIASMTDDYFIDLYAFLFPQHAKVEYESYFRDMECNL